RCSAIGTFISIIPGMGAATTQWLAYAHAVQSSPNRERFGRGAIEGVAGPEATNNASAAGGLVPLLTLGIPTTATAAVMLGAFGTYGIQPGPRLLDDQPELVWGLIASLFIGNTILLALNLPLATIWARLLNIPRPYLYAGILFFASIGAYAANTSTFDLWLLLVIGLLGFFMRRFGLPVVPTIIGIILGPVAEEQLRRALQISNGELSGLYDTWFSKTVYAVILVLLVAPVVIDQVRRRRGSSLALQHANQEGQ
ncbi:MAG TPA: tripartite tricarboxylate transporter permease, partial [Pedococcus sp.]|nr:tripartite tricarboxylate transporter permease [Pedococcus sp.]